VSVLYSKWLLAGVVVTLLTAWANFELGHRSSAKAVKAAGSAVKDDKERKAAPEFELKDADGKTVRLSDYKGKVVLLDFWATWCGGCRAEMPWLVEFEQSYGDKGFAVLGVSMNEDGWSAVKPFLREHQINYRILMGTEQVAQLYGGLNALPETILIDRSGRIASVHVGIEAGKDGLRSEIVRLLGATTSSPQAGSSTSMPTLSGSGIDRRCGLSPSGLSQFR